MNASSVSMGTPCDYDFGSVRAAASRSCRSLYVGSRCSQARQDAAGNPHIGSSISITCDLRTNPDEAATW